MTVASGSICLSACNSAVEIPPWVDEALLDVTIEVVVDGFRVPWAIEVIDEEEYLFTDRVGTLYHYRDGEAVDLDGVPETEGITIGGFLFGGLMDVSLHPQFPTNGLVYIAYVNAAGRMAVAHFDFKDRSVEDIEVVFESNAFSIGSRIAWEDDDHFFVTQGMGGSPYPEPGAQNLAHDAGKIHRLMADGTIPSDNPLFEANSGPTSIWSYGHRNPQGLFFDADEGVLYATEFGPLGGDEFNIISKGGNYGWPLFSYGLNYNRTAVSEMTEEEAARDTILPLDYWDRSFTIGPSGLERLRNSLFPEWDGTFIMGSLPQQRLIAYEVETGQTSVLLNDIGRVRDVNQLPSGSLLLLIDARSPRFTNSGRVVKLSPR